MDQVTNFHPIPILHVTGRSQGIFPQSFNKLAAQAGLKTFEFLIFLPFPISNLRVIMYTSRKVDCTFLSSLRSIFFSYCDLL